MKTLFIIGFVCALCCSATAQEIKLSDSTRVEKEGEDLTLKRPFSVNEPLYILEDLEISRDKLEQINVADIESITVLKDSTATAKYGEKGKYGVILLELRKPKFKID